MNTESTKSEMIEPRFPYPIAECSAYSVYDERYWLDLKHNPFCEKNASIIILGDEKSFRKVLDGFANRRHSFEELLELAERLDVHKWFRDIAEEWPDDYQIDHGDWPASRHTQGPKLRRALLDSDKDARVVLGVLPEWDRWKLPCLLNYGDWNACPPPHVHSAVWKHWQERHVAYANWIGGDELEMTVERPVRTRDEALALAHEQFVYCPDLVHQTYGTLEELAASLIDAQSWSFWWD